MTLMSNLFLAFATLLAARAETALQYGFPHENNEIFKEHHIVFWGWPKRRRASARDGGKVQEGLIVLVGKAILQSGLRAGR